MSNKWELLYSLQDRVLKRLKSVEHGFYLSGGTALSRGYYQHRYSEDLDFFVNDRPEFELWRDRCLAALQAEAASANMELEIGLREERFGRAILKGAVALKLEFINDVPFRVGNPWEHPILGPLDTKENILANKLTAMVDREEPKDLADIYWLCCEDNLDAVKAIEHAEGKAAGIFPPLLAKALLERSRSGVPKVVWLKQPQPEVFKNRLEALANRLLL